MKTVRLIPVSLLAVLLAACGEKPGTPVESSAPVAGPPLPTVLEPAPAGTVPVDGAAVYAGTCALCHGSGMAGSPRLGDKADWGPRIARGKDMLYLHALKGFSGSKGMMPLRGGNAGLSDDEVRAAVDYMVMKSQ